jgi:ParB family transcriptional regulator, chromosome partitioning protein
MTTGKFHKPADIVSRRSTFNRPVDAAALARVASESEVVAPTHVIGSVRQSYAVGTTYDIAIEFLEINPHNSRQIISMASIQDMAERLKEQGQLEDLKAYVDATTGRMILVSGHRRLAAAPLAQFKSLKVNIVEPPPSPLASYLACASYNQGHAQETALDQGLAFKKLLASGAVRSQRELAQALGSSTGGINEARISKLLAIANLPDTVITAVASIQEMTTFNVLYELHLLVNQIGEAEAVKILANASSQPLSMRELAEIRRRAEQGPVLKPRSSRQPFHFGGKKGELRRFDDAGRIELRIEGLEPSQLDELQKSLARVLSVEGGQSRSG